MILTEEDRKRYITSDICHICENPFKEESNRKVRDHCHFTGKYRGAAHNACNLNCRKPLLLPVIFHNLQGYDAHLFIKQLAKLDGDLTTIPATEERYISFSKKIKVDEYTSKKTNELVSLNFEIRFLDSFKFMQTSLANLVGNLQSEDFISTKNVFGNNTKFLTRKGVYPYDYVTSINKFKETKLPKKEDVYSKLNDSDITDDDYEHAKKVWTHFNCSTIKEYHDSQILLSAFETSI